MSKLMERKLVEDRYLIDSIRCNKIINSENGFEFFRESLNQEHWSLLYFRAYKHPEEFECFYDRAVTRGEELNRRYTKDDLDKLSMPKLREIGKMLGVTGVSLVVIKQNILSAQDESIEE